MLNKGLHLPILWQCQAILLGCPKEPASSSHSCEHQPRIFKITEFIIIWGEIIQPARVALSLQEQSIEFYSLDTVSEELMWSCWVRIAIYSKVVSNLSQVQTYCPAACSSSSKICRLICHIFWLYPVRIDFDWWVYVLLAVLLKVFYLGIKIVYTCLQIIVTLTKISFFENGLEMNAWNGYSLRNGLSLKWGDEGI